MALSFTLARWKESKVITIPKMEEKLYHTPAAFRPISLSNYLFTYRVLSITDNRRRRAFFAGEDFKIFEGRRLR